MEQDTIFLRKDKLLRELKSNKGGLEDIDGEPAISVLSLVRYIFVHVHKTSFFMSIAQQMIAADMAVKHEGGQDEDMMDYDRSKQCQPEPSDTQFSEPNTDNAKFVATTSRESMCKIEDEFSFEMDHLQPISPCVQLVHVVISAHST